MKAEDILGADDTEYTSIELWNKTIHLGSLSAGDLYEYFEEVEKAKGTPERRYAGMKLANKSLIQAKPEPGFPPVRIGNDETLAALKTKNPKNVGKLVSTVLELNGIDVPNAQQLARAEAKND